MLEQLLAGASALSRLLAATIIEEWCHARGALSPLAAPLLAKLLSSTLAQAGGTSYSETSPILARIETSCRYLDNLLRSLLPHKVVPTFIPAVGFALQHAHAMIEQLPALLKLLPTGPQSSLADLSERHAKLRQAVDYYEHLVAQHDRQVLAAVGGAMIALGALPPKLTPVIRSITTSLKGEDDATLQARSAHAIAALIDVCSTPGSAVRLDPSDKIVKNLCTFLCQDVARTPLFAEATAPGAPTGILSLHYAPARGLASKDARGPVEVSPEVLAARLVFRGAQLALAELAARFGDALLERVPKLWSCMADGLVSSFGTRDEVATVDARLLADPATGQELLDCLTVLPIAARKFGPTLQPRLAELLPALARATRSTLAGVRYSVARCFAALCDIVPLSGLRAVIEQVLPFLGDSLAVHHRRGAMELISRK